MAKYFKDHRQLNHRVQRLNVTDLSPKSIASCFEMDNECSICVTFAGFDESCLGYVTHVRKSADDLYELFNIAGETEIRVNSIEALILVLRHVCGETYSPEIQDVFQQIRNDIGNASKKATFAIVD